jgi:hypothetical protein
MCTVEPAKLLAVALVDRANSIKLTDAKPTAAVPVINLISTTNSAPT